MKIAQSTEVLGTPYNPRTTSKVLVPSSVRCCWGTWKEWNSVALRTLIIGRHQALEMLKTLQLYRC